VRPPPTTEQNAAASAAATCTRAQPCYAAEAALESLIHACGGTRTRQERNIIMEPLIATAAEATDMVRVGRSAVYRLIAARRQELIKIGRPQRASVASIPHVAAQSAALCMWRAVWL
jgi:hypothetical protein